MTMLRNATAAAFITFALSGCALYNDVSVMPLQLRPAGIDRGADVQTMVRKADFLRALSTAGTIDAKERPGAAEMAALGRACLFAGRFAEARARLRASLDLNPTRQAYADTAWDLSQVEFLDNNLEVSLDWAGIAIENGLQVKRWHLDYLEALKGVSIYNFGGEGSVRVPFQFGRPNVPRIKTRLNGTLDVDSIIDSGAVLSIVSERLAKQIPLRSLGDFEGTFYGLLGEPITVRFGILDSLTIGGMVVENVPVAVMPDEKMRFLVNRETREEYHMNFLLGSNLLKEFRLEMNFDEKQVTFTRLTEQDRRPDADQNLFFNGFRPHVRGAVNKQGWFLFILDTGSEITFLNQSRLGSLPISFFDSGGHTATLQGLGGSMKRGAKIENVEVGFDRWAGLFKTIPMYSSDDNIYAVGIVGQNFLEKFNVVIDFGRMRVDLERR
jgi:hypothetical protein